jgi:hypothetical protein
VSTTISNFFAFFATGPAHPMGTLRQCLPHVGIGPPVDKATAARDAMRTPSRATRVQHRTGHIAARLALHPHRTVAVAKVGAFVDLPGRRRQWSGHADLVGGNAFSECRIWTRP